MATPTIVGSVVTADYETPATTNTTAFTITGGHSNNAVVVITGYPGAGVSPTNITYGGVNMTQLTALTAAQQINGNMWFISDAGGTLASGNVVTTWPSNVHEGSIIFQLIDVAQTSPQDVAAVQSNTGSGTSMNKDITTSTNGDFLIAWLSIFSNAAITAGGSATDIGSLTANTSRFYAEQFPQTTAGLKNMSASWSGSSGGDFFVVALKYLASGTNYTQTCTEAITVSDVLTRSITRSLTEAITVTDVLKRAITRSFTEAISLSDIFAGGRGLFLTLTESISVTDTLTKLVNGTAVIWTKISKSAAAVWTKLNRN